MVALTIIGWLGTFTVLAAYGYTCRTGRARPFHWANACGCLPVAAPAIYAGAYSTAALSLAFGVLGALALIKDR